MSDGFDPSFSCHFPVLLLSNTVRVHRKLRNLGIESFLQVYEGQSHAQYGRDDRIPEVREAFGEIGDFFGKHLKK